MTIEQGLPRGELNTRQAAVRNMKINKNNEGGIEERVEFTRLGQHILDSKSRASCSSHMSFLEDLNANSSGK